MKDLDVANPDLIPRTVKNMEIRVGTSNMGSGQRGGATSVPETRPMTEGNPMISVFNQA
jgi:hypothetical protein